MSRLKKRSSTLQKIAEKGQRGGAPKKRKKPYTLISFNIDDDVLRDLKAIAKANNCDMTETLHTVLREYIERNKKIFPG